MVLAWLELYFSAQEETDVDDAEVIESPIDDRIAPDEEGIYPYLFACVYILFVAWYLMDKLSADQYRRARRAFLSMINEARQAFLNAPTKMRDRSRLRHPLLVFTQRVDGPTNCYPSLHVGLVTLSYLIMRRGPVVDPQLLSAMKRSCIDICRSTMRTKQHSMVDVIGGIALSRRIYASYFGELADETLLQDVLPELTAAELSRVSEVLLGDEDLIDLRSRIVAVLQQGALGSA